MGAEFIHIVIVVITFAMLTGWLFSMASQPEVTLGTILNDYSDSYEAGEAITNPPNQSGGSIGNMFGFSIEIPVISPILNFLSWIIGSLIGLIGNVIVLPTYFPGWMSPIFIIGFLGFIVYLYVMLATTK